jgi:hypothetical protein
MENKMNIDELTLGQVRELQSLLGGVPTVQNKDWGHAIVVADRGFVWFAESVKRNGDFIEIRQARQIRVWGTTKGLAQLANDGPQSGTKLEDIGNADIPFRAIISIIPTKKRWS